MLKTGLWIPSEVIERAFKRAQEQIIEEHLLDIVREMIMEELEAEQ